MGHRMEPIRDAEKVHQIEVALSRMTSARGRRMFLLWEVGVRLGLRIGDLVELKVKDLRGKKSYTFIPQKTRKTKKKPMPVTVTLDPYLRRIIQARCEGMDDNAWLFESQRRGAGGVERHITRQQAWNDLKEIERICRPGLPIGCHTMRKTFGYHYYQRNHDPSILQKWFDHSSPAITLIYIGIAEDNLRKMTDRTPFDNMDGIEL